MSFMQRQVIEADYFEVDTHNGIEIVPADLLNKEVKVISALMLDTYLEGRPMDDEAECERQHGWLARLSAPGYMDCTEWSAFPTYQAASDYLDEFFGDDDYNPAEEDPTRHPNA